MRRRIACIAIGCLLASAGVGPLAGQTWNGGTVTNPITAPSINTGASGNLLLSPASNNPVYSSLSFNGQSGDGQRLGFVAGGGTDYSMYIDVPSGGDFKFRIAGSTKMTLTSAGYLGIGTTSTMAPLDVNGLIHVSGSQSPVVPKQGGYFGWNALTGGTGETDLINNQGGGTGGFAFMNTPNSGSPLSTLMVLDGGGNLKLQQGALIFPDGTTQTTAFNNSGSATIRAGQIVFPDNSTLTSALPSGVVLNKTFINCAGCGTHTYLIATLPSDNDSDYDHLDLLATLNANWGSSQNSNVDIIFGNRGGFRATYNAKGASPTGLAVHIVAYRQGDSSTNIYLVIPDGYQTAAYSIVDSLQEAIYTSPADSGAATPPGTLVFDTASSNFLPAIFTDFYGTTSVKNLKITDPSGSITFASNPTTPQSGPYAGTCSTGGDYAESVDVTGNREGFEPGDIIVIDPDNPGHFLKSSVPYSSLVAGIYSTKPGYVGRRQTTDSRFANGEIPMAMVGIVPTKVTTENGPIKVGDLLVTSSTPGYAMHGTNLSSLTGAVVGKALGSLPSGSGVIEVLVSLQ